MHEDKQMDNTVINRNPNILGGTPVFAGTRVPIRILMEYLETGDSLDDFLYQYPSVGREQAIQLIELATERLTTDTEYEAAP